jgi:hypothetical protein
MFNIFFKRLHRDRLYLLNFAQKLIVLLQYGKE